MRRREDTSRQADGCEAAELSALGTSSPVRSPRESVSSEQTPDAEAETLLLSCRTQAWESEGTDRVEALSSGAGETTPSRRVRHLAALQRPSVDAEGSPQHSNQMTTLRHAQKYAQALESASAGQVVVPVPEGSVDTSLFRRQRHLSSIKQQLPDTREEDSIAQQQSSLEDAAILSRGPSTQAWASQGTDRSTLTLPEPFRRQHHLAALRQQLPDALEEERRDRTQGSAHNVATPSSASNPSSPISQASRFEPFLPTSPKSPKSPNSSRRRKSCQGPPRHQAIIPIPQRRNSADSVRQELVDGVIRQVRFGAIIYVNDKGETMSPVSPARRALCQEMCLKARLKKREQRLKKGLLCVDQSPARHVRGSGRRNESGRSASPSVESHGSAGSAASTGAVDLAALQVPLEVVAAPADSLGRTGRKKSFRFSMSR
eukprot:TRINITY_DN10123_c0_g1_i2.p1 TRINITY_DN10123_c0_g1~~TRINITY_DN10123_c0_g1_i2.p1  ORF type:complete len:431 (+),score=60.95 TRINITY_DN10123_c0_g1_i2:72-1364(+)